MTRSEPGHEPDAAPGAGAPATETSTTTAEAPTTGMARLTISWIIVGAPLAYGVVETIRAVLPLFGG